MSSGKGLCYVFFSRYSKHQNCKYISQIRTYEQRNDVNDIHMEINHLNYNLLWSNYVLILRNQYQCMFYMVNHCLVTAGPILIFRIWIWQYYALKIFILEWKDSVYSTFTQTPKMAHLNIFAMKAIAHLQGRRLHVPQPWNHCPVYGAFDLGLAVSVPLPIVTGIFVLLWFQSRLT